ncbi:MAG TPA: lysophospholipid acyltransferase family protein [Clostridia bacterium]|nr:lysophospholipid acyltransferase family protein [Clostridia bacterium]
MLRTIFWYASGWLYLAFTMPALAWVKYLEKAGRYAERDAFAERFSMMLARGLFYLTGSSVEIVGSENIPEGPVLFVSNHPSHIDSAVIHGFINKSKGFVADKGAGRIPILRTWFGYMKCVFIDRKNAMVNIKRIEESLKLLKEGHSLVIYPEGKINTSAKLNSFRKGCLKLSAKAGVPVVPVTLINTDKVMDRAGRSIHSSPVKCVISAPITFSRADEKNEAEQIEKVREIIAKNLVWFIS